MYEINPISRSWQLNLATFLTVLGTIYVGEQKAIAQLTRDTTLGRESSIVKPIDERRDRILGGATRGTNLFHSFRKFNVAEGRSVYFANPERITNILTRVMGENPSNILGRLGVEGNANLFLLNPNGVFFGSNSSLDIKGSLVVTTASGIRFADGTEFSAINPQSSPVLTISVPIGLQLESNPGNIGIEGSFLEKPKNTNLALVGGNVSLNRGQIIAPGGRVEIGGLSETGFVGFNLLDNRLSFPNGVARANVSFNNSIVNVRADNGGDIAIHAQNLNILRGTNLKAGIEEGLGSARSQAGNIVIDATNKITLNGGSEISNLVASQSRGNAGNITIEAGNSISLGGLNRDGVPSIIKSTVESEAEGKGGNIAIATGSLFFYNGAYFSASTFGKGNAGNVTIDARDTVSLNGVDGKGIASGISSRVAEGADGDGGNITITTASLSLNNGARLSASIFGKGKLAGDIAINARDSVSLSGVDGNGIFSGIASRVDEGAEGNGGNITIVTGSLSFNDGARLIANAFGRGDAGNITINVRNSFSLNGLNRNDLPSIIESTVGPNAVGDGGNIAIAADSLNLNDGAFFSVSTFGRGNAGNVTINANSISLNGADGKGIASGISSRVAEGADGDGGNITITTDSLSLNDGARLSASMFGTGDTAGNIKIEARNSLSLNGVDGNGIPSGIASRVGDRAVGNGGNIIIETGSFFLNEGTRLNAIASGRGNAGNIFIKTANELFLAKDSAISTAVEQNAIGRGGDIDIQTNSLSLVDRAQINASSQGQQQAGNIDIEVEKDLNVSDSEISSSSDRDRGGAINIKARDILLQGDSDIRTNVASGAGGGGNITLTSDSILAFDDSDILAFSRDGRGGNILLNTPVFFGFRFNPNSDETNLDNLDDNNRVDINASGSVSSGFIQIPDVSFIQNSLSELPESFINAESLIANSCIVRSNQQKGQFIVTGAEGLPERPGEVLGSFYPTGEVQTVPSEESSNHSWQIGDPIVEPQSVYQLPNGRLVLSRDCF